MQGTHELQEIRLEVFTVDDADSHGLDVQPKFFTVERGEFSNTSILDGR